MIDPCFFDADHWIDGHWASDWAHDLPPTYWEETLTSICENWITWIKPAEWSEFLRTPHGRTIASDQLFVRFAQSSLSFVPWLTQAVALEGKRILEIGCGSGSSTASFVRAGAKVIGIDVWEPYLKIANTRLSALNLTADLRQAEPDWLTSEQPGGALKDQTFDLIICYALLEHLLPLERLTLLRFVRDKMEKKLDTLLVIYETPNRLSPLDWHSTLVPFPDIVPDELAVPYLEKRLPQDHRWRPKIEFFSTAHGRESWYRGGRGVSFHEFDIAFGLENIEVVLDAHMNSFHVKNFSPDLKFEMGLQSVFSQMSPPVPNGFSRPTLDLVIKLKS